MSKKIGYLFLALLLPVLIFVFLKFFGKNEFAIPVYYENGVDSVGYDCRGDYSKPYAIDDSVMSAIGARKQVATVVIFGTREGTELGRLKEIFQPEEFELIQLEGGVNISSSRYARWLSCSFFLKAPYNVTLIDESKHIRGYYSIGSREEMDRLILEMQILLKKY